MKEKILIGGGSGLVGQRFIQRFGKEFEIHVMSRQSRVHNDIQYHAWDIDKLHMDPELTKADYIINLTGAGIADKRWSESRKKVLIESRVNSNLTFVNAIRESGHQPKAFLAASATGFYGNGGNQLFTEESDSLNNDFMSDCCIKWENSSNKLESLVQRLVILRLGIVLSTKDGALPKMRQPVRFGMAPYFSPGSQYYSWIHIDDLCDLMMESLQNREIKGIYNAVAPEPVTNKEFMRAVQKSQSFPSLLTPVPAASIRLMFGEMGDTVLNSTRVSPKKFIQMKFPYQFGHLEEAIKDLVKRKI